MKKCEKTCICMVIYTGWCKKTEILKLLTAIFFENKLGLKTPFFAILRGFYGSKNFFDARIVFFSYFYP